MPGDIKDKYPEESGRRRFVKGIVGSSALAGVGTATAGAVNTTTNPSGLGGGSMAYVGIENVAGPAPRAMPQIPVRIDTEGYVKGLWGKVVEKTEGGKVFKVAETEFSGPGGDSITYSSQWFQYCGVQTYPGVQPEADQDNYFRHADSDYYAWQNEEVEPGDRIHIDDFENYQSWGNDIGRGKLGKPALATWRSQGVPPSNTMPVQLIRSRLVEQAEDNPWIAESTREGFIAFLNKCTHFCCVPGFKAFKDSEKFEGEGDHVYCQCHQSVYDPFNLVRRSFVALPRPEE
jgi:Rieske Fe-S protein